MIKFYENKVDYLDEEVDLLCDKAKECLLKYYVRTCDDANIFIYGIVFARTYRRLNKFTKYHISQH